MAVKPEVKCEVSRKREEHYLLCALSDITACDK